MVAVEMASVRALSCSSSPSCGIPLAEARTLAPSRPKPSAAHMTVKASNSTGERPSARVNALAAPEMAPESTRASKVYKTEEGFWRLKEDALKGINPQEKLKYKKEGLLIMQELQKLSSMTMEEIDADKELKDDIDVRLKWLGFFHRRKRHYGRFMLRLKVPNGICTSHQVRVLADAISKYGDEGCADITTRQNWQIRGIELKDLYSLTKKLNEEGLSSVQSGMDNVRNCVGNPLAGIDPFEIVDTRPINAAINAFVVSSGASNPDFSNLPRKWNCAVVGSHDEYEHPHINDLAFIPATRDGRMGFNVLVGGFFSATRCEMAIPLGAWVPEQAVVGVVDAVLSAFRDLGPRLNRQKTRMMWLVEEMGVPAFRAEVESRLGMAFEEEGASLVDHDWERRSYFGVNKQKQEGLNWLGLLVPVGRMSASQMHAVADLADKYGSGEVRLTVEQNVILPNIPDAQVAKLLEEPILASLTPFPDRLAANLVACTGSQFCGQAIIETKERAKLVTAELDRTMNVPSAVRMHWTGCPNTCGQVQVADIGFLGTTTRDADGKPVEGVDIYLGGKVGADSVLGTCIREKVPIASLIPVVQELLKEHFGATMKQ